MTPDQQFQRLREVHSHIAPAPFPAKFSPAVLVDDMLYLSGEGPRSGSEIKFRGRVWDSLSVSDAKKAAVLTTLNLLFHAQQKIQTLNHVKQVAELTGYVRATPEFQGHPAVVDASSEILLQVFGESIGEHVRCAIGASSLPLGICIELKLVLLVDRTSKNQDRSL